MWGTAARLYGQRAALLATALFATLAGTQFLGAFATYDAMALFLLALAAWLGVRSADSQGWIRAILLVATGIVLVAADAVKYATALFTPVVIVVVAATVWRKHGGRGGLVAGLTVLGSWLLLVVVALRAGGWAYWQGVTMSTLARPESSVPAEAVLQRAYIWTSLILVLAALGAVLSYRGEARGKILVPVLAAAGLLVPAEQARLHTAVSLQKHVVFGAWFAAIAAGYALARLSRVDHGYGWAPVMALPIAALTLFGSMGQAASLFAGWPNSADAVTLLRAEVVLHPGRYLAEDYDVEAYYLRDAAAWRRWSNTYHFSYPGMRAGAGSFAAAIDHHYFSLVILNFRDTAAVDRQITGRDASCRRLLRAWATWPLHRLGLRGQALPAGWEVQCSLLSPRPPSMPGGCTSPLRRTTGKSTNTLASSAAGCSRSCSLPPSGSCTAISALPSMPGWSPR